MGEQGKVATTTGGAIGILQPLVVRSERPDVLRRSVGTGPESSTAQRARDGTVLLPSGHYRGLPKDLEALVLQSFEFDGLFVEWPDKEHEADMLGLPKFSDVLAWQLDLVQNGSRLRHLYLDSHTGDLVRATLLDVDGNPKYIIDQRDFRVTSGFRFAHAIDCLNGDEQLLATETFDNNFVDVTALEPAPVAVAH